MQPGGSTHSICAQRSYSTGAISAAPSVALVYSEPHCPTLSGLAIPLCADAPGGLTRHRLRAVAGSINAIYYVDMLRWLFGSEPARVSGEVANLGHPDEAQEDFGVATVVFQNDAIATIEATWTAGFSGIARAFHLVGGNGQLLSDGTIRRSPSGVETVGNTRYIDYGDPAAGWQQIDLAGSQGEMTSHMLRVLRREASPVADVHDARATLAACLAFYEAAKEHKTVRL